MFFLGKSVPRSIKMRVELLLKELPERFSTDFEKNKAALETLGLPFSRFDRNLTAAFLARKLKAAKKQ